jgi:hypothetical protein
MVQIVPRYIPGQFVIERFLSEARMAAGSVGRRTLNQVDP